MKNTNNKIISPCEIYIGNYNTKTKQSFILTNKMHRASTQSHHIHNDPMASDIYCHFYINLTNLRILEFIHFKQNTKISMQQVIN